MNRRMSIKSSPANESPLFSLEDVSFRIKRSGKKELLFDQINLQIKDGEKILLIGENGSGKTTLLRLINGLYKPSSGKIFYLSMDLHSKILNRKEGRIRFRKENGFLFQLPDTMFFHTTVRDEIAFGPETFQMDQVQERVLSIAKKLQIENLLDRAPYELSYGEKKRVALAALLVNEPRFLLLDEPLAGLDPPVMEMIADLFSEMKTGFLLSTHDLGRGGLGSRVVALDRSHRIVYDGDRRTFFESKIELKKAGMLCPDRE